MVIKIFQVFTWFRFNIVWNTRNIRSLFQIKDKVKHYSCIVYEGNCSCGQKYVGESVRNVVLRCAEHEDPNNLPEPAKHLTTSKSSFLKLLKNCH